MKFTDAAVRGLSAAPGETVEIPSKEFRFLRLRVSRTAKSWSVLRRQRDGPAKRVSIGSWPEVSCSLAYDRALKEARDLRDGLDPVATRRAAAARSLTVADALAQYIEHRTLRPNTITTYTTELRTGCADWLDRPLASLTPEQVLTRHRERSRVSPIRANLLVRILNILARAHDLPPLAGRVTTMRAWAPEPRRTGHLRAGAELRAWVAKVKQLEDETARDVLLLIVCTALRHREAAHLRWDEVDLAARLLTLPGSRTKNKHEHVLPIGPRMVKMLKARYAARRSDVYVFPGPRDPAKPILRVYDKALDALGRDVSVHDLRRTTLTLAESLDVPAYALARIANHVNKDQTASYLQIGVERLRGPMGKVEAAVFAGR